MLSNMLNDYILVAAGTAAAVLGIVLFLLRLELAGRRPGLHFTRRWVAQDRMTSTAVLALIAAAAVISFASVRPDGTDHLSATTQMAAHRPILEQIDEDPEAKADFNSLAAYANSLATGKTQAPSPPASKAAGQDLPDVTIMIEKLVQRLETEPGDARGWKMLGWSYLNTDRPKEAVTAYERALALTPSDDDAKKGLEQARAALSGSSAREPAQPR